MSPTVGHVRNVTTLRRTSANRHPSTVRPNCQQLLCQAMPSSLRVARFRSSGRYAAFPKTFLVFSNNALRNSRTRKARTRNSSNAKLFSRRSSPTLPWGMTVGVPYYILRFLLLTLWEMLNFSVATLSRCHSMHVDTNARYQEECVWSPSASSVVY
jgi:hypothetical protein